MAQGAWRLLKRNVMSRSKRSSRSGHGMTACGMTEHFDSQETLEKKVTQLADLLRASRHTVVSILTASEMLCVSPPWSSLAMQHALQCPDHHLTLISIHSCLYLLSTTFLPASSSSAFCTSRHIVCHVSNAAVTVFPQLSGSSSHAVP